jgi:hypothetical protein
MLDAMGIMQHHDAITGTAKQHVSDDYTRILYNAIDRNNIIYEEMMNDHTFKLADIKADRWFQCFKTNSTWLDCPLANYNAGNVTFLVNVHNPTLDYMQYQRIKVPHDKYRVFAWDETNSKWENVRSQIFCLPVKLINNITINDCELHVENMVYPNHFSVLMVQYDPTRVYTPGDLNKISYVKELTEGSMLKFVAPNDQEDDLYLAFNFK